MSLPPDVRQKYITIIDSILDGADLTTITRKDILKGIQDQVEFDITPQKVVIKEVINERFDVISSKENGETTVVPSVEQAEPAQKTNGVHTQSPSSSPAKREAQTESDSDVIDTPRPKKKRKASLDADAAYAARLQAEEDARARPTRGGTTRKSAPAKRKKKVKKDRVTGSDDSDIDDEGHKAQKPKRNTGFHVSFLAPARAKFTKRHAETAQSITGIVRTSGWRDAVLTGIAKLSRPETTKRLWAYIKSNDLQDPSDKRYILCDSKMREVFRQDKVHMFTMTKLVSQQMYNPEE
ncbi:hypothetical protein LTR47_002851 [Exophiala xenobiotica]|nr:hypothetical protein LTR47_002851 [Exophiala xenobiotica]KAK5255119.1 hypothetical protein LTS06_000532 [Exophiala xenobiotica]KAK5424722.1 hypothetical protein LTR90_000312 [Exophiala xenobiotica]KAK5494054.1 hypothetical protein LTR55_002439 [Exophiala xenobiotica]KAK5500620.1 hypothetical protein LTR26_000311 [Exophiala xenobiotica]